MKSLGILFMLGICLTAYWTRQDLNQASSPTIQDKPSEMKLENLLKKTLSKEFVQGREVIVSYAEIPPNTTMDRHWHPGEEFHYYLAGKVTIDLGDGNKIIGTSGKVGHVPYKKLHTAITGEEGAKLVVFRIHEKGKPVRYLEDGSSGDK